MSTSISHDLIILFFLIHKHFIVDFLLQNEYQWKNKGTYLHPGGILHAFLHGISTFLLGLIVDPSNAVFIGLFDMFIHYHIDYFKMKINSIKKLSYTNPAFWKLLGLDQYLHYLTYLFIFAYLH